MSELEIKFAYAVETVTIWVFNVFLQFGCLLYVRNCCVVVFLDDWSISIVHKNHEFKELIFHLVTLDKFFKYFLRRFNFSFHQQDNWLNKLSVTHELVAYVLLSTFIIFKMNSSIEFIRCLIEISVMNMYLNDIKYSFRRKVLFLFQLIKCWVLRLINLQVKNCLFVVFVVLNNLFKVKNCFFQVIVFFLFIISFS